VFRAEAISANEVVCSLTNNKLVVLNIDDLSLRVVSALPFRPETNQHFSDDIDMYSVRLFTFKETQSFCATQM
jgi:hypothetical protein